MSTAGSTAQDPSWKGREQSEENKWAREKESAQIQAIHDRMMREAEAVGTTNKDKDSSSTSSTEESSKSTHPMDRDFEGGFGGQEDLEDRYATTSGEH
ncbi:hypothetical protein CVT24_010552 [Panaeolus cyanescens]|uniref:Uncharacterized protein n=1 Tax=Panaeolus cyanescens TaxID=181874 RepID=A0A409YYK6_9AGAR|nr:hypothetical protein CVT24_010552 [Panaeolus cyanescens]